MRYHASAGSSSPYIVKQMKISSGAQPPSPYINVKQASGSHLAPITPVLFLGMCSCTELPAELISRNRQSDVRVTGGMKRALQERPQIILSKLYWESGSKQNPRKNVINQSWPVFEVCKPANSILFKRVRERKQRPKLDKHIHGQIWQVWEFANLIISKLEFESFQTVLSKKRRNVTFKTVLQIHLYQQHNKFH